MPAQAYAGKECVCQLRKGDLRPELRRGHARDALLHRLPESFRPAARRCLVVGGGEIGLEKVEGLLACDGEVTLIAPEAERALAEYAAEGSIRWERRAYAGAQDLEGVFMAIAATSDTDVNIAVYDDAERRAMLVNVVDVPPLCNFILPAIVRTRPARDRDLDRGRLAGPGQAHQARDRRTVRRAVRAAGGPAQRGARLGQGDVAHLPGPQAVLRGDRERRPRPGGVAARGPGSAVRDLIAQPKRARAAPLHAPAWCSRSLRSHDGARSPGGAGAQSSRTGPWPSSSTG